MEHDLIAALVKVVEGIQTKEVEYRDCPECTGEDWNVHNHAVFVCGQILREIRSMPAAKESA